MHARLRTAIAPSLAVLVLGLALGVAACSSDSDEAQDTPANEAVGEEDPAGTEGSAAAPSGDTIVAANLAFDPTELTVASGTEITVENQDSTEHTFTVDGTDIDEDLAAGDTANVTIDLDPGEYGWVCTIHPSMTGTLTVT
jgi:plastocyanin